MSMPAISILDKNLTQVEVNGMIVYFSYETPVAFRVPGHDTVVHENVWSNTTGKHLNKIDGGNKTGRVNCETFCKLWAEQNS